MKKHRFVHIADLSADKLIPKEETAESQLLEVLRRISVRKSYATIMAKKVTKQ